MAIQEIGLLVFQSGSMCFIFLCGIILGGCIVYLWIKWQIRVLGKKL